ncbi:MAG: excinuclease ABC subunit UvrC [Alphaproteobacteria bacterium]
MDDSGQTSPKALRGAQAIDAALRAIPSNPGVYRMMDEKGDVLYVGKARNLHKRVSAYAQGRFHTQLIARMVPKVARVEITITDTETEALLLESNLIKRLKPPYNVHLRDDKSFPYILMARDHAFPQLIKHRGAQNRQGEYYGPFASAKSVTATLNTLQKAFLLRSCSDHVLEGRTRPCLLYQIKRCSAPCVDLISKPDYDALVDNAAAFLTGASESIKQSLTAEMEQAAADMEFERAAALRDRIRALAHVRESQGVNLGTDEDADLIAAYAEGNAVCVQVVFFRGGQNFGSRAYFPRTDKSNTLAEVMTAFIGQFYDNKQIPPLVMVSHEVAEAELLSAALTLKSNRKVVITKPQRGQKRVLVKNALDNAAEALGRRKAEAGAQADLLAGVAAAFDLDGPPQRIETYDNSHISGTNAIGAMVVAGPEGFMKNQYRSFNIKDDTIAPGDDFAMMREVMTRRFSRLMKEDESRARGLWPDLVLIDGGAGQLSAVQGILEGLGIEDVPLVGISKGPDRNAGREQFHIPGRPVFMLEPKDPVLFYLQRLRDEAHRFAIGTHRARRGKAQTRNPLDGIDGIGPKRKRALLNHFGSARAVQRANLKDLEAVEGISGQVAKRIFDYFRES